jgi:NAD(P)-dependent dehydrogenase (short-subunit alcohol dehydrogenase family)
MSDRQVAVIVGVGPGLGFALVRRFAGADMAVALAARSKESGEELLASAPVEGARAYACDATDKAAVDRLFAQVEQDLGAPEVVVFNAGAFRPGGILEIDPAEFEQCWRIGCYAGFLVGQAAARRMVAQGHGTILFTGATAALRGSARFANLAVPKFGLRAFVQSMARELGPQGVHVGHVIIDGQILSER